MIYIYVYILEAELFLLVFYIALTRMKACESGLLHPQLTDGPFSAEHIYYIFRWGFERIFIITLGHTQQDSVVGDAQGVIIIPS